MLRKSICGILWLLAMGASGAIVYYAMGTSSVIVTVIGAIGVISAGTGVYLAMEAHRDRALIAMALGFGLWFIGESFLIFSEFNFWSAVVSAKAERETDKLRQANGRRMILDETASKLAQRKPGRSASEIEPLIAQALAAPIGKKTLAMTTKACTDLQSPAFRYCNVVLNLRAEQAAAQKYEESVGLVWDANTKLAVDTNETHGASDGSRELAEIFGGMPKLFTLLLTAVTMLLLAFVRGTALFQGWRVPKAKPIVQAEALPVEVQQVPETKKPDWTKPETYQNVPETAAGEVKQVSPFHAEINRMAGEICDEGRAISSEQAHKRITVVARQHQEAPWKQKAVTTALRKACLVKGFRIESAMRGRGYRITGRVKEPSHFSQGVLLPA